MNSTKTNIVDNYASVDSCFMDDEYVIYIIIYNLGELRFIFFFT